MEYGLPGAAKNTGGEALATGPETVTTFAKPHMTKTALNM